jgi:hypothetical protein
MRLQVYRRIDRCTGNTIVRKSKYDSRHASSAANRPSLIVRDSELSDLDAGWPLW